MNGGSTSITYDKAYIKAFNGRFRAVCLNAGWFLSMAVARERIDTWRLDCYEKRPHTALGNLTPRALSEQARKAQKVA
jgi:putative transposase